MLTISRYVHVLLIIANVVPFAGASEPSAIDARAARFLEDLRDDWEAPAVSAAVAVDGKVVFAGAAGVADSAGTSADEATRFRIASVSKPITAVLILDLAEEGLLDLDASVRRYVPELPEHYDPITSRQLLAHTSGVRHYERGETSHKTDHYDTPLEALSLVLDDRLRFEPGTDAGYTTYGYTVLQAVAEAVTGEDFETLLRSRIFEPADMIRTSLDRIGEEASRATGFDRGGPVGFDDVSFKYAGGGMASTPTDLVRFCGALTDGRLIEPETLESLLRPPYPALDDDQSYGFAVEQELMTGLIRMWHPGRGNGFEAYLLCYPEEGISAALVTNQDWTDPWNQVGRATETLARLYLPAIHLYRTPPQVLVRRLETLIAENLVDEAVAAYADYREEIDGMWGAGLEIHRLAERLTAEGRLIAAEQMFEANAEASPESWQSQLALSQARLRTGKLNAAAEALEAARPLVPAADLLQVLEETISDLRKPAARPPEGEYELVLRETGLAEEVPVRLSVKKIDGLLEATARAAGLGELPVHAVLAGGDRLHVVAQTSYGVLELAIQRRGDSVEGLWQLGFDSGPLEGHGP